MDGMVIRHGQDGHTTALGYSVEWGWSGTLSRKKLCEIPEGAKTPHAKAQSRKGNEAIILCDLCDLCVLA